MKRLSKVFRYGNNCAISSFLIFTTKMGVSNNLGFFHHLEAKIFLSAVCRLELYSGHFLCLSGETIDHFLIGLHHVRTFHNHIPYSRLSIAAGLF